MSAPGKPSRSWTFDPAPQRAKADTRLRPRHHRILLALCDVMAKDTGIAFISQEGLGKRGALSRQKVGQVLEDLENWGYVEIRRRGRHGAGPKKGQIRTRMYRVHHETSAESESLVTPWVTRVKEPCHPVGDKTHVTYGVTETITTRINLEDTAPLFEALREADRFDDHVEVAQQLKLPLPEVQHLDLLRQRAVLRFGFHKIVQLEQRLHNKLCVLGTATRNDYYLALREKLEELLVEPEAQARDGCA